VVLVIAVVQRLGRSMGLKFNLIDGFIEKRYPHLWNNEESGISD
jgi:hypothetical protein